jgi:hypothetical protein
MTLYLLKVHLQTFLSVQELKNIKFLFVTLLSQMSDMWPKVKERALVGNAVDRM